MLRIVISFLTLLAPALSFGWSFPADLPRRDTDWSFRRAREALMNRDYTGVPLNLVTRAQWHARKITEAYEPMGPIKGIVIHHSETPEDTTIRSIQQYHQRVKKWADIGYHYIIGQFPNAQGKLEWRIFSGRPLTAKGAHAGRMGEVDLNPGEIGICIIGDFDQPGTNKYRNPLFWANRPPVDPTMKKPPNLLQADPRAVFLLGLLVDNLMHTYSAAIKEIRGHGAGDHPIFPGHKTCPGEGAYHYVEALRARYGMDSIDRTSSFKD